jgi:hypothetical protein
MNSLTPAKMLGHSLVLISTAFLLQANSLFAAGFADDPQTQAQDLLSGTVGGRAKTVSESPANPADGHQTSNLDPQEQARRLILGEPNAGGTDGQAAAPEQKTNTMPAVSARSIRGTYGDPQESAQRMILGHAAGGTTAPASRRAVSLTQKPLVMRLDKDEFRIAFGLNAGRFASNGCNGVIDYRIDWRTEDGTTRSLAKRVNYTVLPGVNRTITVDHQYLDTVAAAGTTEVVKVSVDKITCLDSRLVQTASTAAQAAPDHRTGSTGGDF